MKPRTLLQGAGVAALVSFPFYRSMLDLPSDLRMHLTKPFTSVAASSIFHLAGQTAEETITTPFPLLRIHDILDDLIEGRQPAYASSLQNAESSSGE